MVNKCLRGGYGGATFILHRESPQNPIEHPNGGADVRGLVAVAIAGGLAVLHPATALEFKTAGVSGSLQVSPGLGACGTLVFPPGETFVGQLTAVAYLEGPGTKVGTVRRSIPIVASGSWYGCIPGSYSGAAVGDGKFALTGQSATNDYTNVKQCVVSNGTLTCV